MRAFVWGYFPNAEEKYAWPNQDCVSLDGIPYIGAYNAGMKDVYTASSFNFLGMPTAMAPSEILDGIIGGKANSYAAAFALGRNLLTGQLFAKMTTTIRDFVTITTRRYSYLGYALKWNPSQHSWDCLCRGSRFNEHGRIIENPAMRYPYVE